MDPQTPDMDESLDRRRERRNFLRVPKLLFAMFQKEEERSIISGLITDISIGGVRLVTEAPLPAEATLSFTVELARDIRPIHLRGSVAWSCFQEDTGKYEQGISFVDLPEKKREALVDYITFVEDTEKRLTELLQKRDVQET